MAPARFVVAVMLVLVGPTMAFRAAAWFGLAPAFAIVWRLIRWPVIVFCAVLGVDLVYHVAPNSTARWAWITPGALVATRCHRGLPASESIRPDEGVVTSTVDRWTGGSASAS